MCTKSSSKPLPGATMRSITRTPPQCLPVDRTLSSAWTLSVPVEIPGTGMQVYILFCVDNHEDQRKTCRSRHTNTVFGQQEVLLAEYGEDDLLHETCHFVKKWSKDPQRPERGKES